MPTLLLARGEPPSTFLELAGLIYVQHAKRMTLFEWMLQDAFQEFLEGTYWLKCEVEANRPRRGDLAAVSGRHRRPYFVVELKRAAELSPMHEMQGRNYSALHGCPCIITNGIEYRLIIARDHCSPVSVGKLPIRVTQSQHISFDLGRFELKKTHDGARERLLAKIFASADEGQHAVQETIQRFAATAIQRARVLPPPSRSLPSSRQSALR